MDALLDILDHYKTSDRQDFLRELFHAIVCTLEKVIGRSQGFVYLGDDYINNRFSVGGLSEIFLSFVDSSLRSENPQNNMILLNIFKVGGYLSSLINASGKIEANGDYQIQDTISVSCKRLLQRITDQLKVILGIQENSMVALQTLIVQNLFKWYTNLRDVCGPRDILLALLDATDSIRTDNQRINIQRLLLIRKICESPFYHHSQFRTHITTCTIKWTLPFWVETKEFTVERKEQLRLVCGIYAVQFDVIWPIRHDEPELCKRYGQLLPLAAKLYTDLLNQFESTKRTTSCTIYSPLFPSQFPFESKAIDSVVNDSIFDEALLELGIVFTLLVNIAHFSGQNIPNNHLSHDQLLELANNILKACTAILNGTSVPKNWVSLLAVHHEAVLGCLDYLSDLMKSHFIPSPDEAEKFETRIWYDFLDCVLRLAGSEFMAIEHQSEQKRTAIWKISKDLRGRAVTLLKSMWDAIGWPASEEDKERFGLEVYGGYQVQMFGGETSIVKDILNLCLARHPTTQSVATQILYSMIISEWTLNEDLIGLQREMIISLDDIFQSRTHLPESYEKKSFSTFLRSSFTVDSEDESYPYINHLLDDVEEFLDLLLDLYSIPPGDAYNDDRIFHALNVLNFLKDVDRVEIFSRYVNDIAQWNKAKRNFTQAGLALRLLASAYEWSYDQKLPASEYPPFPPQSGFERKEALYEDIIQNFTKGKAFENAIDATKELINAYETVALDFGKLASVTRVLAKLYDSVDSVTRVSPQYFRVAYIGVGFPRSLRNRQFIFEGSPSEKLETIHDRLHKIYPGVTIVSNESQAKPDGQYLYVSAVVPEYQRLAGIHSMTQGAREYHGRLNLKLFSYSRPLAGNTSALDLWVEKTVYETYQVFPTIVKRSEVKAVNVIKLSPLENALQLLEGKITELSEIEQLHKKGKLEQGQVSKLEIVLSGSVDSPVNGGIGIYRAFLEDDTLKTEPNSYALIQALESTFLEYTVAIKRCLTIHGKLAPPALKPLHDSWVELFEQNFAPELALLAQQEVQSRNALLAGAYDPKLTPSASKSTLSVESFEESGKTSRQLLYRNRSNSISSLTTSLKSVGIKEPYGIRSSESISQLSQLGTASRLSSRRTDRSEFTPHSTPSLNGNGKLSVH
jgi:dedicator of cytokinesis protein 3